MRPGWNRHVASVGTRHNGVTRCRATTPGSTTDHAHGAAVPTRRSTTEATPSSSLLDVTSAAIALVASSALPIATPWPAQVNIS